MVDINTIPPEQLDTAIQAPRPDQVTQFGASPPPSKRRNLKRVILSLSATSLIITSLLLYSFIYSPRVAAQQFIDEYYVDYQLISDEAQEGLASFTKLLDDVDSSEESFAEITTLRNYSDAVQDTNEDIEQLQSTLEKIETQIAGIRDKEVRDELEPLRKLLDDYYNIAEKSLELQIVHQRFQLAMLNAYGPELDDEINVLADVFNTGDIEAISTYFTNLSQIVSDSRKQLSAITDIPESEETYYQNRVDYLNELSKLTDNVIPLLVSASDSDLESVLAYLQGFSNTVVELNNSMEDITAEYVAGSELRAAYDTMATIREQILAEADAIISKYHITPNFAG